MTASIPALIVAGEASGDQHAAALAACVADQQAVAWFGIGGDAMQAAGVELVEHARRVNVLGLAEVVQHLPRIYRVFRRLLAEVDRRQPRLAVLVDFPDFNLRLARRLHTRGIPVIYFIAPQIWAWRAGRLRAIQRDVCKVLCIFPFEEAIYRRAGVDVEYVGHPLVGRAVARLSREQFLARYGLTPAKSIVCLLPGSRNQEVARHLPILLAAAERLQKSHGAQFLLVRAPMVERTLVAGLLAKAAETQVTLIEDSTYDALAYSEVAVVSSGTATVEAALLQTPMVVVYRVAPLTWWLGRWLVQTPYYSMVNLIAGGSIVPELIQAAFTPARVAKEAADLLNQTQLQQKMKRELRVVGERLGKPGAIERAGRAVLSLLAQPGLAGVSARG